MTTRRNLFGLLAGVAASPLLGAVKPVITYGRSPAASMLPDVRALTARLAEDAAHLEGMLQTPDRPWLRLDA